MRRVGDDAPANVAKFVAGAAAHGWHLAGPRGGLTAADGPPSSIVARLRRGPARMFVLWRTEDGCRFRGGAAVLPSAYVPLHTLRDAQGVVESD